MGGSKERPFTPVPLVGTQMTGPGRRIPPPLPFKRKPSGGGCCTFDSAPQARTEQLLAERDDDDDGEPEGAWLYRHMLPLVGDIVREVAAGGGEALWGPSYDGCRKYYAALKSGAVTAALLEPGQDGQLLEVCGLGVVSAGRPRTVACARASAFTRT